MRCLTCKNGTMEQSTTTYFAHLKNCYVIIENVPCMKCDQCGEEFFTASVLEKIEDILDRLEQIALKVRDVNIAVCADADQHAGEYIQRVI